MNDSPASSALDLSPEALHQRLDEESLYLPPKKGRPIWLQADVYLTAAGRAVFPDGQPLFVRAGDSGAETAQAIAQTTIRGCGCRLDSEDGGRITKPCRSHA